MLVYKHLEYAHVQGVASDLIFFDDGDTLLCNGSSSTVLWDIRSQQACQTSCCVWHNDSSRLISKNFTCCYVIPASLWLFTMRKMSRCRQMFSNNSLTMYSFIQAETRIYSCLGRMTLLALQIITTMQAHTSIANKPSSVLAIPRTGNILCTYNSPHPGILNLGNDVCVSESKWICIAGNVCTECFPKCMIGIFLNFA